jgi:hypothetical protein
MVYYANLAIDSIQNAKNTFLDTVVKEESVKAPMKSFVEAQRIFTKQIAKSFSDMSKAYTNYDYREMFKSTK